MSLNFEPSSELLHISAKWLLFSTAILLAATSALVASGSQPQALLGEGWLKPTLTLPARVEES